MDKKYIDDVWERISSKMKVTALRNRDNIPYTTENGRFDNYAEKNISWWTNGFWPGLMWLMYKQEGDLIYKEIAENSEKLLDEALKNYRGLHHDVGFMYHISAGASYRITNSEDSRSRAMYAASVLASRFNMAGSFIRAWDNWGDEDHTGWSIIDCMMNIPLLYWASRECGDPRFKHIAQAHADMVIRDHVRADGSVKHIVIHDPVNGEVMDENGGQGFGKGSSWSRGQAWALYGFILSYIHTGEQRYLDTAKRVAHYFISNVCSDWVARCDFRAPAEPVIYDTSAGLIAACGLIELSRAVSEFESDMYMYAAVNMIKAVVENFCNWDPDTDSIVQMFSASYHGKEERHIPVIYADFFLVEAFLKLKNNSFLIW